ncbi:hypothetical protein [Streptomyces anulatus]|uniref:hypothetical protein n=1 Tax=Streptomyces anulatus TaxID=1892 RepID=UPI0033E8E991
MHLDRGMHAAHAMEDESEDLAEIASVILDAETGYFTDEVSDALDYVGAALLVMDRVTLDEPWRGFGLGPVLAIEAIHRLMPGCRAIVCSPGIADISEHRLREHAEWDRVTGRSPEGGSPSASATIGTTSSCSRPLLSSWRSSETCSEAGQRALPRRGRPQPDCPSSAPSETGCTVIDPLLST